jgi:hypothetical protein
MIIVIVKVEGLSFAHILESLFAIRSYMMRATTKLVGKTQTLAYICYIVLLDVSRLVFFGWKRK